MKRFVQVTQCSIHWARLGLKQRNLGSCFQVQVTEYTASSKWACNKHFNPFICSSADEEEETAQRCSISKLVWYLLQPWCSFYWCDKELIPLHLPSGSVERAKRGIGHYLSTTEPKHVKTHSYGFSICPWTGVGCIWHSAFRSIYNPGVILSGRNRDIAGRGRNTASRGEESSSSKC